MKRRVWETTFSLLLFFFFKDVVVCSKSSKIPPHILLALLDDVGWNDLNRDSSEASVAMPFLDSLWNKGVRLKQHYVQALCSPTRGAVLTGRYPLRWGGVQGVAFPGLPEYIGEDEVFLPLALNQLGYSTKAVGKWHLGFATANQTAVGRGFDEFFGIYDGSMRHFLHTSFEKHNLFHDKRLETGEMQHRRVHNTQGLHGTEVFTREAIRMVRNHESGPLFMYLSFSAPHMPNEADPEWVVQNNLPPGPRRDFGGMLTMVDDGLRRVVDAFKENNLWPDTVLILFSDNGGEVIHGASNWPLRGSKETPWEGGVRSAGLVYSLRPDLVPVPSRGSETWALSHAVDVFPTVLSLAGAGDGNIRLGGKKLDGVDVWDSWVRKASPARSTVLLKTSPAWGKTDAERLGIYKMKKGNRPNGVNALRVGTYKLIQGLPGRSDWYAPNPSGCFPGLEPFLDSLEANRPGVPDFTVYHNRSCMLQVGDAQGDQIAAGEITHLGQLKQTWLFDIEADPEERHDLSEELPLVVTRLENVLSSYLTSPDQFPARGRPSKDDIERSAPFDGFDIWNDPIIAHDLYRIPLEPHRDL